MTDSHTSVAVQGRLLAECIEEGGVASEAPSTTETVRPHLLGPFVEHHVSSPLEGRRQFVIVLKNPRQAVTVRGTGLRYIPFQGEGSCGGRVLCRGRGRGRSGNGSRAGAGGGSHRDL